MAKVTGREQVMQALFALISGSDALLPQEQRYVTKQRGWLSWTQIGVAQRPALFMAEGSETYQTESGRMGHMPIRILSVDIWIYVTTLNQNNANINPQGPASILNPYLDALDTILQPRPPGPMYAQTLGGLVTNCYVDGEIVKVPGYNDGIGLAIVPIRIVVP